MSHSSSNFQPSKWRFPINVGLAIMYVLIFMLALRLIIGSQKECCEGCEGKNAQSEKCEDGGNKNAANEHQEAAAKEEAHH